MYDDGLRRSAIGRSGVHYHARLIDGTVLAYELERYLGPADATDEQLLDGLCGPVLDVGCGPGRHLRALAARGVFALGVDLSPVAVELAIGGGSRAIVGDIFDDVPGGASWRSALLLDGNIGIGGAPVRLLTRVGALLVGDGELLVEVQPPGATTRATHARLEHDGVASAWFPWACVSASAIGSIAAAAGLATPDIRSISGRWFARLTPAASVTAEPSRDRLGARARSVP